LIRIERSTQYEGSVNQCNSINSRPGKTSLIMI
jgi:hypothetical protein